MSTAKLLEIDGSDKVPQTITPDKNLARRKTTLKEETQPLNLPLSPTISGLKRRGTDLWLKKQNKVDTYSKDMRKLVTISCICIMFVTAEIVGGLISGS